MPLCRLQLVAMSDKQSGSDGRSQEGGTAELSASGHSSWVFDALRSELAGAVAIAGGVMLGTGWLLTWVRLSNEDLPSDSIMSALPVSYFIQVALKATLVAFALLILVGIVWTGVRQRFDWLRTVPGWVGFGVALTVATFITAAAVNQGTSRLTKFSYLLACAGATIVAGVAAGKLGSWAEGGQRPDEAVDARATRRAFAATIVLCFVSTAGARLIDAAVARNVLPVAGVLVRTPCIKATGGVVPNVQPGVTTGAAGRECVLAGFYLGESSKWIFLVKRRNPHRPENRVPSFLLTVPRDDVEQTVIVSRPELLPRLFAPPNPRKPRAGATHSGAEQRSLTAAEDRLGLHRQPVAAELK